MLEYNETVQKNVASAGNAGIVLGIIIIVAGVALGTLSIIFASKAVEGSKQLID